MGKKAVYDAVKELQEALWKAAELAGSPPLDEALSEEISDGLQSWIAELEDELKDLQEPAPPGGGEWK